MASRIPSVMKVACEKALSGSAAIVVPTGLAVGRSKMAKKPEPQRTPMRLIMIMGHGVKEPRRPNTAPEPKPKKPFTQKSSRPKDW